MVFELDVPEETLADFNNLRVNKKSKWIILKIQDASVLINMPKNSI